MRALAPEFKPYSWAMPTPEVAARIMEESGMIDVRARLAQVTVPTLVTHPRGDAMVPFEQARYLAAGIPDARFVELDSQNHILTHDEPAWPSSPPAARRSPAGTARPA